MSRLNIRTLSIIKVVTRATLIVLTLLAFPQGLSAKNHELKAINIAAIDWCPQLCPNSPSKGYVHDIVRKVYNNAGYKIVIDYYPWSRAIELVRAGTYVALLSPAKKEAPDLIYPSTPIGSQRMCFFVDSNSKWHYNGIRSLSNIQIGVAKDVSIEKLNIFMHHNSQQFQFIPYNKRYIEQSVEKVLNKHINTFLFTRNTTIFELKRLGLMKFIKEAGCVSKEDIYIAFSPHKKIHNNVQQLTRIFDNQIRILMKTGEMHEILRGYNVDSL